MKDTEMPEDVSEISIDYKPSNNYVGLKFALPVLGGLLLLVVLTAGALLYQNPGPQTTSSSAAMVECGELSGVKDGSCVILDYNETAWKCTCPNQTESGVTCDKTTGGNCGSTKNTQVHTQKKVCLSNTCGTQQIDHSQGCFISRIYPEACGGSGGGPTPTRTRTPTQGPSPTRTPTPGGPSPTRTRTPTPVTPVSGCVSYTVDETSGTGTRFLRYQLNPSSITELNTFCSNCDAESMDNNGSTVYVVANDENNTNGRLCILDKSTGALDSCKVTDDRITALSFRSGILWGWKQNAGLVTLDVNNGAQTLQKSSSLDIEGIAWDNGGSRLYLVKDASKELYQYNPSTGSITLYASNLPSNGIDAIDFSPDGWLVGESPGGGVTVYAYDVANKTTKASWNTSSSLNNWDAMTAMCDLPDI